MTEQFTKLTDSQWAAISVFFNTSRKRKLDLREIINAILYLLRTGCQWRNLPTTFPSWRAVNYYFEQWKKDGTIESMNQALNQLDRKAKNKRKNPSLLCIDSQSVKLSPMIYEDRGIDGNKKVNGRKRQVLVDSDGRIWAAQVHAANIHDGVGGISILASINSFGKRIKLILGDKTYRGKFAEVVSEMGLEFEVGSKPENVKSFVVEKKRWVVERTFAWLNFFRRVAKDYEYTVLSSATWILLANISIMIQRIE